GFLTRLVLQGRGVRFAVSRHRTSIGLPTRTSPRFAALSASPRCNSRKPWGLACTFCVTGSRGDVGQKDRRSVYFGSLLGTTEPDSSHNRQATVAHLY